jgi:ATP-binding cassette subfamily C (CFTR/MRP) protein 1
MFRMATTFRGSACSNIFHKALATKADGHQREVVTLMSTDVDRLTGSLGQLTGIWALIVEVGLGVWLLWRQLGAVSTAPIIVVLICFGGQSFVSKFMPAKQRIWLQAIGRRVKFTSSLLRSMKSVKLAGLVDMTSNFLQNERVRELNLACRARWYTVWQNIVGELPKYKSALCSIY